MFDFQKLAPWGWPYPLDTPPSPDLIPARVLAQHREAWLVQDGLAPRLARLTGHFLHLALGPEDLPTVGDWVWVSQEPPRIHALIPRRNALTRRRPGPEIQPQMLAANVDTALLVCGLDHDYNPRRLERALSQIGPQVDRVAVILTKADLDPDPRARIDEVIAQGFPECLALSALEGRGLEQLDPLLAPGTTLVMLGSSGAGKSTLLNALLGQARQRVREVRLHDQRGRHTTTHRELFPLPGGALLIDTPGLREWQLWEAEPDPAFGDLALLGRACRFRDCRHEGEPGCAVAEALASGELEEARVASYRKLRREADFQRSQEDPAAKRTRKAGEKELSRAIRRFEKEDFKAR